MVPTTRSSRCVSKVNSCQTGGSHDPSKLIGSISAPGAAGCKFTQRDYSGSTLRFALDCAETLGIAFRGSVEFGATRFSGEIAATGTVAGQTMDLHSKVAGTRIGGC